MALAVRSIGRDPDVFLRSFPSDHAPQAPAGTAATISCTSARRHKLELLEPAHPEASSSASSRAGAKASPLDRRRSVDVLAERLGADA